MKERIFWMLVDQIMESLGYDGVEAALYAMHLIKTGKQIYESELEKENEQSL